MLFSCAAGASVLEDIYYTGETPGAAALGRGGAYSAVKGDAYASFWNPAGLAALSENLLAVSSDFMSSGPLNKSIMAGPLSGSNLNYIAIAGPEVGMYWRPLALRVEDSTGTRNGESYRIKRDVKINMFGLSVGVKHAERVDFGMNMNFIFGTMGVAEITEQSASAEVPYGYGWGIDWGLIYRMSDQVNAGVVLRNGPSAIYWDKGFGRDRLPPILRAGLDIRLSQLMSVGVDYEKSFADSSVNPGESVHLGVEHYLAQNLILRAGVYGSNLDSETSRVYTAGLGYMFDKYNIDLAARQAAPEGDGGTVRRYTLSGIIPF